MLDVIKTISLDTPEGQRLLSESSIKQMILLRLPNKQKIDSFCGLATAADMMSSHFLAGKYPDRSTHDCCDISDIRYTEDSIFDYEQTQSVLGSKDYVDKRREGISLTEIAELFKMHGYDVLVKRGDESHLDEFRRLAKEALSSPTSGIILNFHHYSKVTWGHFSSLAAYHEQTDSFLIMDTRIEEPFVWVAATDLYPLINTVDPFTNLYRGYLTVSSL